jgi:hypothetical protein
MIVRIHDIVAVCPRCGADDFEQTSSPPLRLPSELQCTGCGAKTRYLALLDQIGEEAIRRANEAIENLKKNPKRPSGPKE